MLNYVFVAASTRTLNGSSEFADIGMYSCYIKYAFALTSASVFVQHTKELVPHFSMNTTLISRLYIMNLDKSSTITDTLFHCLQN